MPIFSLGGDYFIAAKQANLSQITQIPTVVFQNEQDLLHQGSGGGFKSQPVSLVPQGWSLPPQTHYIVLLERKLHNTIYLFYEWLKWDFRVS